MQYTLGLASLYIICFYINNHLYSRLIHIAGPEDVFFFFLGMEIISMVVMFFCFSLDIAIY